MTDEPVIVRALEKIISCEMEITRLKNFINEADKLNGAEPRFGDIGAPLVAGSVAAPRPSTRRWQAGEFFNKPLSTVVRMILLARAEMAGGAPSPASVDEIHDALIEGSFDFETNGADAQKNGIRISLGKNSAAFVRLPNTDLFGLIEWYGKKQGKPGRKAPAADAAATVTTEEPATADDEPPAEGGEQEKAAA